MDNMATVMYWRVRHNGHMIFTGGGERRTYIGYSVADATRDYKRINGISPRARVSYLGYY